MAGQMEVKSEKLSSDDDDDELEEVTVEGSEPGSGVGTSDY